MLIKDLNIKDRPREKLINKGANYLSDDEILAIILNTGSKDLSAIELAHKLLEKYTLRELICLNYEDLAKVKGIKASKASKILASFELAKRAISCFETEELSDANKIYEYVKGDYLYATKERFILISLDSNLKVIKKTILREGFANNVEMNIRDIMQELLRYDASCFIICHNHPSGNPTPSREDKHLTNFIFKYCYDLNFLLVEHLIWTRNSYFSFNEDGFFKLLMP